MIFNLERVGNKQLRYIKESKKFPFHTGNLKFNATSGMMITKDTYQIKFDSTIAPYVVYLQEGTEPHNIPKAFGRPLPFGTSGRFNGKFHPGSIKHKGFIDKFVEEIVNNIANEYGGQVERL